ncbi:MAG TPA: nucleotidyl transferase AbiEii/AbiGii toxin family protein [Mycobacteriales bacterium]|nr:nucleotidyl transferase AbiEii/AbiGii toxin family protein [Mycobacteriales bacterium]
MSDPTPPARPAPVNLRSLRDRLRNAARDADLPEGRLVRQLGSYAVAEMLARVTDEAGESLFLIKGGTSIEMRLGVGHSRASKDLDAAFRGSFDTMYAAASEALAAGWSGFSARVLPPTRIENAPGAVKPIRFEVKLAYVDRPFCTVPVEVSVAEAGSGAEADSVMPAPVAHLGVEGLGLEPNTAVRCLSLRYQIAQKLHACTERFDAGRNDRARDLVDLQLLGMLVDDWPRVREACVEIFDTRSSMPWPPDLQPEPHWDPLYGQARADVLEADAAGLAPSLDQAVAVIRDLITAIESAR